MDVSMWLSQWIMKYVFKLLDNIGIFNVVILQTYIIIKKTFYYSFYYSKTCYEIFIKD